MVHTILYSANIHKAQDGRKNKEKSTINRVLYFSRSMGNWVDKIGKGFGRLNNFKKLTDNELLSVQIHKSPFKCLWNTTKN